MSPEKIDGNGNHDMNGKILGKNYFRDPEVNLGFYSKKREGVADVDPKVNIFLKYFPIGNGAFYPNSWKTTSESCYRQTKKALCFP